MDAAWFKAEYLPAAEKLEEAYAGCSAEVTETITDDRSDDFNMAKSSFAFDGVRRKYEGANESHKGNTTTKWSRAMIASPEVSFRILTKEGTDPILERVNRTPLGFAQATAQIDSLACDSIYSPFALLSERVTSWLKRPGFRIKSIRHKDGRVRLEFHCTEAGRDREYEGWIEFLPDRQWVIHSWDVTLSGKAGNHAAYSLRYAASINYSNDDPVPHITGMVVRGFHGDWKETDELVVDDLTFATVAASEFKLSHYGYDDRIGMQPGSYRSLWFWLATACVLCLVIAFVIRQIMSRRAAA